MSALSTYFKLNHYKQHHRRTAGSLIRRLAQWQINWRTRRQLARLPDHMLRDIGISRSDAEQEASKQFWEQ